MDSFLCVRVFVCSQNTFPVDFLTMFALLSYSYLTIYFCCLDALTKHNLLDEGSPKTLPINTKL